MVAQSVVDFKLPDHDHCDNYHEYDDDYDDYLDNDDDGDNVYLFSIHMRMTSMVRTIASSPVKPLAFLIIIILIITIIIVIIIIILTHQYERP